VTKHSFPLGQLGGGAAVLTRDVLADAFADPTVMKSRNETIGTVHDIGFLTDTPRSSPMLLGLETTLARGCARMCHRPRTGLLF
jgi:hypothetical protein